MVLELYKVKLEHPSKYSEGQESSDNEFTSEEQSLPKDDSVARYLPSISLEQ